MTDAAIENAIASSVVGLTSHVMAMTGKPDYESYRLVTDSEVFRLLADSRTRFFLRTNEELNRLYDAERTGGMKELARAL